MTRAAPPAFGLSGAAFVVSGIYARRVDLIETPDGWAEQVPDRCPECGHRWTKGQFRNSWRPCICAGTAGHRGWQCVACSVETYDPPHTPGSWEGIAAIPIEQTPSRPPQP